MWGFFYFYTMMKHIKDIAIIALLVVVMFQTCGKQRTNTVKRELFHSDTVFRVEKPVINEHHYTNIRPERVVEVHHYHDQPVDTDAVVRDYFRARHYRDSLVNDTVSYWWSAKVFRNTLDSFYIRTSYKPRTRIITNSYEVNRPAVGLMALYAGSTPYIGAFGTWQRKRFSVSGGISPMNEGAFLFGIGWKIR